MENIDSFADGDEKEAFTNAYNAAKALFADVLAQMEDNDAEPAITMQSIIDANGALNDRMLNLRKKPSKELKNKITSLVDYINTMSIENYNAVQIAAVKAEGVVLMNMLNNSYITAEDAQEKFNHVLAMVNELENNVPVTPENPDDTGNVTTPEDPADNNSTANPTTNNTTTKNATTNTSGTTKVATGDASSVGGLFGLIGMSGAVAWIVSKKRKIKNKSTIATII